MKIKRNLHLSIISFFIIAMTVSHADGETDFANHLFNQREYYRAITEYERHIFERPQSTSLPHAHLQIARAYYEGERFAEARTRAQDLLKNFPQSEQAKLAPLLISGSYLAEGKLGLAAMELDRYATKQIHTEQGQQAAIQSSIYYLRAKEIEATLEMLDLLPESTEDPRIQTIRTATEEYENLAYKSPKFAGTLSALLPGAGQLYVGKKSDALLSFLLNGVLLYATYEAFDNGEHVTGALLGLIETGWYGGNIYNAVNSAHKVNEARSNAFLKKIEIQCRPFWPAEKLGVNIEALFKF